MEGNEILPGVLAVEHTADLALDIEAATPAQLFDRAAAGMFVLIEGADEDASGAKKASRPIGGHAGAYPSLTREIVVTAPDLPALLVAWLRELLHLHRTGNLVYRGAEFAELESGSLRAEVRFAEVEDVVREIKGVTYHGLEVGRRDGGWYARVVFDV